MPPKAGVKYDAAAHERMLHILISEQKDFKPDCNLLGSRLGVNPNAIRSHLRIWKSKYQLAGDNSAEGDADEPELPAPKRRKTTQQELSKSSMKAPTKSKASKDTKPSSAKQDTLTQDGKKVMGQLGQQSIENEESEDQDE